MLSTRSRYLPGCSGANLTVAVDLLTQPVKTNDPRAPPPASIRRVGQVGVTSVHHRSVLITVRLLAMGAMIAISVVCVDAKCTVMSAART